MVLKDMEMKKSLSETTKLSQKNDDQMRRSISDKTLVMFHKPHYKDDNKINSERFLITINVFGSAGPMRFVVNGRDDKAGGVIETALKLYAREGRLPILGSDVNHFLLYPANAGFDALKLSEAIGSRGVRNFVLCKNQNKPHMTEARAEAAVRKGSKWRAWLQKSLSLIEH